MRAIGGGPAAGIDRLFARSPSLNHFPNTPFPAFYFKLAARTPGHAAQSWLSWDEASRESAFLFDATHQLSKIRVVQGHTCSFAKAPGFMRWGLIPALPPLLER